MKIKASVYTFFYEVMNKGLGDVGRHSRYRLYQHLQRSSMKSVSDAEREDWGCMSLFRSLAVNDADAGPPGYARFEEIFWVLADFFGTEVVVFTPMKRGRDALDPSDGFTLYSTRVYGQSPGRDFWPCRPLPLEGTHHHPLRPRFFNAQHQVLLVAGEDLRYVMPVRKAPMVGGPHAGDVPVISTRLYDDEDRWFRWGPEEQPMLRPPNVYLLYSSVPGAAHPPSGASIDTGGFSSWLPACDLEQPLAATTRHDAAEKAQPQDDWPAPEETWTMFEAGFDAPQMARRLERDTVMDSWQTWTDVAGTVVTPPAMERFMIRDGQDAERRYLHEAQAKLREGIERSYVEGWGVPDDGQDGSVCLHVRKRKGSWEAVGDDSWTWP